MHVDVYGLEGLAERLEEWSSLLLLVCNDADADERSNEEDGEDSDHRDGPFRHGVARGEVRCRVSVDAGASDARVLDARNVERAMHLRRAADQQACGAETDGMRVRRMRPRRAKRGQGGSGDERARESTRVQ